MSSRQLVPNVWAFMERASDLCGRFYREQFDHEIHSGCLENGLESPIEDLFWIAVHAMCKTDHEPINPDSKDGLHGLRTPFGTYLTAQARVGKYRVDFVMTRVPLIESQRCAPLVVELDGHDFHDKDKKQRAYEKARDRFLVKSGYRVVHFTGSEIVADPFKVAHEVLCLMNAVSCPEYDPANPLRIE